MSAFMDKQEHSLWDELEEEYFFFFFFVEEEYFHEQSQIIGSNHGPGDMRLWFESQLKGGRFLAVPQVSHLTAIS